MEKILDIYDIFKTKNGETVLAGVNSNLDSLSLDEIHKLFKKTIKLISYDGNYEKNIDVLDIEISFSLIGKKNIFLKIIETDNLKYLVSNSAIYSVD